MKPVYTLGDEKAYDLGIANLGEQFMKLGATATYPGGYALETVEEAAALCGQLGRTCRWAVYELDADWEKDTYKKPGDTHRSLLFNRRILRKVASAEECRELNHV